MFKFKLTCDEATTICDKSQYKESTLLERLSLNLHFIKCKYCKCYSQQNTYLSSLYKKYAEDKPSRPKATLSNEDKRKFEEALKQKIG